MYCKICGCKLKDDAKFCMACGEKTINAVSENDVSQGSMQKDNAINNTSDNVWYTPEMTDNALNYNYNFEESAAQQNEHIKMSQNVNSLQSDSMQQNTYTSQNTYAPQSTYAQQNTYAPQSTYAQQNTYTSQSTYAQQNTYAPQSTYASQNTAAQQNAAPQQNTNQMQNFNFSRSYRDNQPIYVGNVPPQNHAPQSAPVPYPLGMSWFHFLIYFSLWAVAVVFVINAISCFLGFSSYDSRNTLYLIDALLSSGSALEVYISSYYKYTDFAIVFMNLLDGSIYIALTILLIIARFKMAAFKKEGIQLFYSCYGAHIGVQVGTLFGTYIVYGYMDSSAVASMIISAMITAGYIALNAVYFNKRKYLFH